MFSRWDALTVVGDALTRGIGVLRVGIKPIKYWIDSTFRDQVVPVPGSVLYTDLWVLVEHSGIYVDAGRIANIEVDGVAQGVVRACGARSFTAKSTMGQKIYVSCNANSPVGHANVADAAQNRVGERSLYGLVIKNCHQFSTECVRRSPLDHDHGVLSELTPHLESWELTLRVLKDAARRKLGATSWRLWDWEQTGARDPEPDAAATSDYFENLALDENSMAMLRQQLAELEAYDQEIAGESIIPPHARAHLTRLRQTLLAIAQQYDEVKGFLAAFPGVRYSYAALKHLNEDFAALAREMQSNPHILRLVKKLGRDYITQEKKQKTRISRMGRSEVHGIHQSGDVLRVLPCELVNLEDDTLEMLFYARLLEQNLLTYQLKGEITEEHDEAVSKNSGPVVACLDTSGSMGGAPMLKAKALLLAIASILQKERRQLHVLLFGSSGQVAEHQMSDHHGVAGLLAFLQKGYGGGTDFETPLRRAFDIIEAQTDFTCADVLMVTDGDCGLSDAFVQTIQTKKNTLDCTVYTVLCAGSRVADRFSDELVVL